MCLCATSLLVHKEISNHFVLAAEVVNSIQNLIYAPGSIKVSQRNCQKILHLGLLEGQQFILSLQNCIQYIKVGSIDDPGH